MLGVRVDVLFFESSVVFRHKPVPQGTFKHEFEGDVLCTLDEARAVQVPLRHEQAQLVALEARERPPLGAVAGQPERVDQQRVHFLADVLAHLTRVTSCGALPLALPPSHYRPSSARPAPPPPSSRQSHPPARFPSSLMPVLEFSKTFSTYMPPSPLLRLGFARFQSVLVAVQPSPLITIWVSGSVWWCRVSPAAAPSPPTTPYSSPLCRCSVS